MLCHFHHENICPYLEIVQLFLFRFIPRVSASNLTFRSQEKPSPLHAAEQLKGVYKGFCSFQTFNSSLAFHPAACQSSLGGSCSPGLQPCSPQSPQPLRRHARDLCSRSPAGRGLQESCSLPTLRKPGLLRACAFMQISWYFCCLGQCEHPVS